MNVYERIDSILNERHISRRALARMAGIKETTLAAVFARRSEKFPRKYIEPIAKALDVAPMELTCEPLDSFDPELVYYDNRFTIVIDNKAQEIKNASPERQQEIVRKLFLMHIQKQLEKADMSVLIRVHELLNVAEYNASTKGETACPGDAPSTEAEASDNGKTEDGKQ